MKEISIYHPPGNFVFIVRDKSGVPIYVGGTENINQKSFKFKFDFADITGYYYSYPDFWDEVDRKICELNPLYNTRLHGFTTKNGVKKKAIEFFKSKGRQLPKEGRKLLLELLNECEKYSFQSDTYYTEMDCDIAIMQLCENYGIHYL